MKDYCEEFKLWRTGVYWNCGSNASKGFSVAKTPEEALKRKIESMHYPADRVDAFTLTVAPAGRKEKATLQAVHHSLQRAWGDQIEALVSKGYSDEQIHQFLVDNDFIIPLDAVSHYTDLLFGRDV